MLSTHNKFIHKNLTFLIISQLLTAFLKVYDSHSFLPTLEIVLHSIELVNQHYYNFC